MSEPELTTPFSPDESQVPPSVGRDTSGVTSSPLESAPQEQFVTRHIGPRATEVSAMVAEIGYDSLDALIDAVVPTPIRSKELLDLPEPLSEIDALDRLRSYAAQNTVVTSMIGMGYYGTNTPGVIARNILENPAWYTAYTPYQPEISQGRLEALLNFQTMISDLCGLDIANASMLDEATAAAEAMTMALRATKSPNTAFFVDSACHPQTIAVLTTRAEPIGIELIIGDPTSDLKLSEVFGVLLSSPSTTGALPDHRELLQAARSAGVFTIIATDLLALCLLESPGALGADAAVGSSQRFGVPLGFGGPHAGFLATTDAHKRAMPGRLVGVSIDSAGRRAYRLALQTREQHIRREKATSNICTAQVLLAVMASMYAVYHGPEGLRRIAERVHGHANQLAAALRASGIELAHDTWFDTITAVVPDGARAVVDRALANGVNLRLIDADRVGVSCDETTTPEILAAVADAFGASLGADSVEGIPANLQRRTALLDHDVFHRYRSETEMLRYIRSLADKDLALDRAMIPLGSCTMKLNATSEMLPVSWPEFAQIHPFAPEEQTSGYRQLFEDLEGWLAEITGYDAVSLQPNAGSQGEFAGLMAIRAYHRANGELNRNVCLIPSSAHGTNAASAVMVGMKVVVVACRENGDVDIEDLAAKATQHANELSAMMITYPSTHGVFETAIEEMCAIVHDNGGQVYLDGANMNALVGLARPGRFGSDVSHLNLHKTFCIPHGGGGPGVGPIGVRSHLAPFLPGNPVDSTASLPVAAAAHGSASILPISWMYIAMMGAQGLLDATRHAILAANYVAARLEHHYPVLYTGAQGRVAHECIIDIRPIERQTGVTAEDIAKRLIDYGFHAPTMSFPVAGTLMIEPTESESREELDRFCNAMLSIKAEIDALESSSTPVTESVLRRAPHVAEDVVVEDWDRPYSRTQAVFPSTDVSPAAKYWPPVGRVDNGYGDRNLVCSCPPVEAYAAH